MENNTLILKIIETVLMVIIVPLLGFAMKKLNAWLITKVQNETAEKYISISTDMVYDVVASVSQTYVSTLKQQGKFDAEAQKKAFGDAMKTAKTMLSEEAKKVLSETYGDIDKWLSTQIESAVGKQKG